jgi:hypothetical protein
MSLDRGKASGHEYALKSDISWVAWVTALMLSIIVAMLRYGCATGLIVSRDQSPRVERTGRRESLSSSFCRWRASRPL